MNVGPGIFVLLIGLLAVSAVVTGIIYLFIKGGTFIRLFLGILFILVLLAVPFLFYVRAVPRPIETHADHAIIASSIRRPDTSLGSTIHIAKDPALWQGNLEQELTPEVYSSSLTAAYGLGMQLHETFSAASNTIPKRVSIIERPEIADPILLEQLRQGLMRSLSDTQIVIMEPAPNTGPSEEDFWVSLSIQNDPVQELIIPSLQTFNTVRPVRMDQFINSGNQMGSLQAAVETPKGKFFKQVSYDYRPWLFDTEKFRSLAGYGQWAVMTSSEAATTQEQAQSQVMESAVHYLNEQLAVHKIATAGAVQSDLRERGFIVDEYSQELKGLSGPIWRAAVLLEVSTERLESLRTHVVLHEHQVRRSWVKLFVSIGGMIFVIVIVYTIMNALTKGYYSGRFAILAVILIILFSLFLLFIQRSSPLPPGLF